MMHSGQVALVQSWDEFFPGLDADDSKVKGLWEPAKPLTAKTLRPALGEAASTRSQTLGHQGGSCISLSKYSKNQEAAWIFMQWGCCKEIMTRCTLARRLRADAQLLLRRSARQGQGQGRRLAPRGISRR